MRCVHNGRTVFLNVSMAAFFLCGLYLRMNVLSPSEDVGGVQTDFRGVSFVASNGADDIRDGGRATQANKPLFILLVSSSGRSGSTMMSELLGTLENTVVFFEPIWLKKNEPCFRNGSCVPGFLSSLAVCNFKDEFAEWMRGKGIFLRYYHPEALRCFKDPKEGNGRCRRNLDLRGLCHKSHIRVVKVIRSRLSWIEGLLKDNSLNMKAIYLVRDPRGSIASMQKLGWNSSPAKQCSLLDTDLKDFNRMVKLYPEKLLRVQLEKMCIQPQETVTELFRFLFDDPTLSERAQGFVEQHMRAAKSNSGAMDTVKNSSEEFQAWRWEISEQKLSDIEKEPTCQSAIRALGHVIFGSYENARNGSVSLRKTEVG
ncbi:carbohydrate sulfotransferase 3-like [Macrobrachium nipponense]|uniref:carbohydrate sulfotransferase 3-like n=1 Tax=Macrobrachium nipponense TaxID=159736 RepID=UPI0030C8903C